MRTGPTVPRMPLGRLILVAAVVLAAVALAVVGLQSKGRSTTPPSKLAFPRERLAGAPVTLSSLVAHAGGRPVLVVFWASWCGPCEHEAPALQRFSQSVRGRGRIVGVDWSDALSGARAFVRRYTWTFPNVRDADGSVGNDYGLTGLPTTFVLDRDARIVATLRGPQDERSLVAALAGAEGV